jgi:hypothetical protein
VLVDPRGAWARAGAVALNNAAQAPAIAKVNFMKFSESLMAIGIVGHIYRKNNPLRVTLSTVYFTKINKLKGNHHV